MLESDLAAVAVEVHTIVGSSIAVSGQRVVRATGIVACTLTGIFTEEHAAGIDHLFGEFLVVFRLDDQMLRSVGIREFDSLMLVMYQHQRAVLQGLLCDILARQLLQLTVHLCLYVENHLFRSRNEQHLRVYAVLSL